MYNETLKNSQNNTPNIVSQTYTWPKDEIEELLAEDFEERFVEHFGLNIRTRYPKSGTRCGWVRYGNNHAYSINVTERCFHCFNGAGSGSMWSFYTEYCRCDKDEFKKQCEEIGKYIGYNPILDDETKRAEQDRRIAEAKKKRAEREAAEAAEAEAEALAKSKKAKSEINKNQNAWRYNLKFRCEALKARGFRQDVLGDDWAGLPDCIGVDPAGFVFYQNATVKYIPSDWQTGKRLKDKTITQLGGNLQLDLSELNDGGFVALVEGEFDALSLWHIGIPAISIKPDSKQFSEIITRLEKDGRHGVAFYDADDAGERYRAAAVKAGAYDAGRLADVWGNQNKDANDFLIELGTETPETIQTRIAHIKNKLNAATPSAEITHETETKTTDYPLNTPTRRTGPKRAIMEEMANIWAKYYRLIDGKPETLLGLKSGIIYGGQQTRRLMNYKWDVTIPGDKPTQIQISWNDAVSEVMPYEAYCKPRWVYTQKPKTFYKSQTGEIFYNTCEPLIDYSETPTQDAKEFGQRLISFIQKRFKTSNESNYYLSWLYDARANTARKPGVIMNFRAAETGTGKNTLGYMIPCFFVGKIHCGIQVGYPSQFALERPLQTLLFAMNDEVWQDNKAYSRLKNMATESPVLIEYKGKTPFMCDSSTRQSTGSNSNVDFIEDAEDRRACMFEMSNKINNDEIIDILKELLSDEHGQKARNYRGGFIYALKEHCIKSNIDVKAGAIDTKLKQETYTNSILSKPEVQAAIIILGKKMAGLTSSGLADDVSKELKRPMTARTLGYALRSAKEYFKKSEGGKAENRVWTLTEKGKAVFDDAE